MRSQRLWVVVMAAAVVLLAAGAAAATLRTGQVAAAARELKGKTEGKCWDDDLVDDQPDGCPKTEDKAIHQVRVVGRLRSDVGNAAASGGGAGVCAADGVLAGVLLRRVRERRRGGRAAAARERKSGCRVGLRRLGLGYWLYQYWGLGGGKLALSVVGCCVGIGSGVAQAQAQNSEGMMGIAVGMSVTSCCVVLGQLAWWITVLVQISQKKLYPQNGCMYVCNFAKP